MISRIVNINKAIRILFSSLGWSMYPKNKLEINPYKLMYMIYSHCMASPGSRSKYIIGIITMFNMISIIRMLLKTIRNRVKLNIFTCAIVGFKLLYFSVLHVFLFDVIACLIQINSSQFYKIFFKVQAALDI